MKQKLKDLIRQADRKPLRHQYKRDKQDRIIIPMVVQEDNDFLSVFAETETPLISTDIAEYLEEKITGIPPRESLLLRVRSSCIDPVEQEAYREGIRVYYQGRYRSISKELRRNNMLAAILVTVGLLALLTMSLIDTWTGNAFWTEVVDIVAWVFVWESVDVFAFRNYELRVERIKALMLMVMETEFLPLRETAD